MSTSIERINYLVDENNELVSKSSLLFKQKTDSLLFSIIPSDDFEDISSINMNFRYKEFKLNKEFKINWDNIIPKILSLEFNKIQTDPFKEENKKQNLINLFTYGLGNLICTLQIIQDYPNFLPLNSVQLPHFRPNSIESIKEHIDKIKSYLINISKDSNNIIKKLSTNCLNFFKYFYGMFIEDKKEEEIRIIQENILPKQDIIEEEDSCEEDNFNSVIQKQIDYLLSQTELCNDRVDSSIKEFSIKEGKINKMNKELKDYVDDKVDEIQALFFEHEEKSCKSTSDKTEALSKEAIMNFESTIEKNLQNKFNERLNKIEKEISGINKKYNNIENILGKIVKIIESQN